MPRAGSAQIGRRYGMLIFAAVIIIWPLLYHSPFVLDVMVMAGLYATLTLGLGILLGQAGQISLGQGAFFGIGAYTAAILTTRVNVSPLLSLAAAAVLAGVIAYAVGRPILRLKSYFLALGTLALAEIFVVVARQASWTGGQLGIEAIPQLSIGGFTLSGYFSEYYFVWIIVLVLWFLTERSLASRVGRALRAVAVNEVTASALGVYTASWKLRAFVLSAVYTGIGGALYAFIMSAISYTDFDINLSFLALIMVIVGGLDSLFGAIIGAVLMTWLAQALAGYAAYSSAIYALILILLLLFLPVGIIGGLKGEYGLKLWRSLRAYAARARLRPSPAGTSPSVADTPPSPGPAGAANAARRWLSGGGNYEADASRGTGEILRLAGVSVAFGGVQAVNQVSMVVPEGSVVAVIGPNGAGKTTLFNIISGLEKPSAGQVQFGGRDITGLTAADITRLGMARTFQNLRLFPNMTVLENVMVGRHPHEKAGFISAAAGLTAREEEDSYQRSLENLALVGLEHLADRPVTSLSYGQQRLVEVARALATEPRLLLLDEPAAGMNAGERTQLLEKIAWIRRAGVTVLLVEHNLDMVMSICDMVFVLDYGRLIAKGPPAQVQADPAVIEVYVGGKHDESRVARVADGTAGAAGERALLEVQGVSSYYGLICAVRDASIRAYAREIVAVLGANGAGKTTLLRTLSGLHRPQSGRVMWEGRDVTGLVAEEMSALGVGHVPEGRLVFPTLSVHDNLALGACRRTDKAAVRDAYEFVYGLFPVLGERRGQTAGTLSGGEQQMLAIGRALMGQPRLLLLDEPSMGLAPVVVEHIFATLVRLNEQGLTLVVVEQNAERMLAIAHHAFVLQSGTVAYAGRAADLARDERLHALYLGDRL